MMINPTVIGAAIIAAFAGGYFSGAAVENTRWSARYSAELAAVNAKAAEFEAAAREAERHAAATITRIEDEYRAKSDFAKTEYDRLLADYRAGAVRLRQRFTCTAPAGSVPGAASNPSQRTGDAPGGLRAEDAEFLVRLAGDADSVARQLSACQSVLRSVTGN